MNSVHRNHMLKLNYAGHRRKKKIKRRQHNVQTERLDDVLADNRARDVALKNTRTSSTDNAYDWLKPRDVAYVMRVFDRQRVRLNGMCNGYFFLQPTARYTSPVCDLEVPYKKKQTARF